MGAPNFRKDVEEYHDIPFYEDIGKLQEKY